MEHPTPALYGKRRDYQKTWAWVIGSIFLLIGIAGFAGGFEILHDYHNGLHVLSGLFWFWAAWKGPTRMVNQYAGLFYILLGIVGFIGILGEFGADLGINLFHLLIAGGTSAAIGWFVK